MRYRVIVPKSVQKELDRLPDSGPLGPIGNRPASCRRAGFTIEEIFNLTEIDH